MCPVCHSARPIAGTMPQQQAPGVDCVRDADIRWSTGVFAATALDEDTRIHTATPASEPVHSDWSIKQWADLEMRASAEHRAPACAWQSHVNEIEHFIDVVQTLASELETDELQAAADPSPNALEGHCLGMCQAQRVVSCVADAVSRQQCPTWTRLQNGLANDDMLTHNYRSQVRCLVSDTQSAIASRR